MAVDSQRLHDICINIHEWWAAPIFMGLTMYLLWLQVGNASFAGLAFLLFLAPINGGYVARQFSKIQVGIYYCKVFVIYIFSNNCVYINPTPNQYYLVSCITNTSTVLLYSISTVTMQYYSGMIQYQNSSIHDHPSAKHFSPVLV